MVIYIPRLEEFELSQKMGFLPHTNPLIRLTKEYYQPWEKIMDNYNKYIFSEQIRKVIDKLPILSIDFLDSLAEKQRSFVILGFMAHAYVWSGKIPSDRLPASIAKPWEQVSLLLKLRPIISYASVCLWNWRYLYPEKTINLSNITTLHTFSNTNDESWFYLISTVIEFEGAPCLQIILNAIAAAYAKDKDAYIVNMKKFSFYLEKLTKILCRMYEQCDPYIFYWKIRPYLSGWKNMSDAGLPRGVVYEGCSDEYRQYSGGSNGQSALMHLFDIALGIDHYPTGLSSNNFNVSDTSIKKKNFFQEMKEYMPGTHRQFLEYLEKIVNIRQFSLDNIDDFNITSAYNSCVSNLKIFRDKHLQIVTHYIIIQSKIKKGKEDKDCEKSPIILGLAQHIDEKENLKGTGGTNLVKFLKQTRDETNSSIIKLKNKSAS